MGATDYGTQSLTFDYKQNATSETFNKLNYKLHDIGIYEGGVLTKINDTTVQISPLLVFIQDSANEVGVRIDTQNTINFVVSTALPYVVLRFVWVNAENNYMDVVATDEVGLQANDIIIGKCIFDGSTMRTTFDYSMRTEPYRIRVESEENAFDVNPKDPASNQVEVIGGTAFISGKLVALASGDSPTISSTTLGRIDLVYIDYDGNIQVKEGIDAGSPVIPSYPSDGMVIAKITRGASKTVIEGSEIEKINPHRSWTAGLYSKDNTPMIYLDNTNNYIGIGKNNPGNLMDIKSPGSGAVITIERSSSTDDILRLSQNPGDGGSIRILDSSANIDVLLDSDGNSYFINNIGFGTDTPLTQVHIQGTDVATSPAGGTYLTVENDGNCYITLLSNNSTGSSGILFGDVDNNAIGQISYFHSANYMVFYTNNSEQLRINSDGNIGVSTTDIESWSGIKAIEFPFVSLSYATGNNILYINNNTYNDGSWKYKSTAPASQLLFPADGTCIFKTATSGTIDTAITWINKFRISNLGDIIGIGGFAGGADRDCYFYFATDSYIVWDESAGDFIFRNASTNRFRITDDDYIGIGGFAGGTDRDSRIYFATDSYIFWDESGGNFKFIGAGNSRFAITDNDTIGIGGYAGGTDRDCYFYFATDSYIFWDESEGDFIFRNAGTNRFVITDDDTIGIGGFAGGADRDSRVYFASDSYIFWDESEGNFIFQGAGTNRFIVKDDDTIGIGGFAGGANRDSYFYFATDSYIVWDESNDGFSFSKSVSLSASSTETRFIKIGKNRTGNGYAYIDFIGDATYDEYGLRIIRNNTGENTTSQLIHKGTGDLRFVTDEIANIVFYTNSTQRLKIDDNTDSIGIGGYAGGSNRDCYFYFATDSYIFWDESEGNFIFQGAGTNRFIVKDDDTIGIGGFAGGANRDCNFYFDTNLNGIEWDNTFDDLVFKAGGTESMRCVTHGISVKDIYTIGSGTYDIGTSIAYFNEVNAKAFTDRSAIWLEDPNKAYDIIKNLENEEEEGYCAKVESRGQHRLKYSNFPDYCWDNALEEVKEDIYFDENKDIIEESSFKNRNKQKPKYNNGDKIVSAGELTNLRIKKKIRKNEQDEKEEYNEIGIASEGFELSAGLSIVFGAIKKLIENQEIILQRLNDLENN